MNPPRFAGQARGPCRCPGSAGRILRASLTTLLCWSMAAAAEPVDRIVAEGMERAAEGRSAQQRIDQVAGQTGELLRDYRQLVGVVDGLKVYNGLLQRQVDNQEAELTELRQSIEAVTVIERQVAPLMLRMIDALEEFVRLDLPFLEDERRTRIAALRAMMERADVLPAEKFRRVLEAYQVEIEYGNTIEAYKGRVEIDGRTHEVDFLRIGRIALLYQGRDGAYTGAWDRQSGQWRRLTGDLYRREVARGLRMARKQAAPDLLMLPVPAAEAATRP